MYVALTFDDGYLEHARTAYMLARLGIKATFFIITHLRRFEGKPLLTSRPELIERISRLGHEIGSHTCTHPILTELDSSRLDRELRESKRFLEDLTGVEVLGLAYPYGIYNAKVIRCATKYYYYARATDISRLSGSNSGASFRYTIQSIGVRSLHDLVSKLLNPVVKSSKTSVFIHKSSLSKAMALVSALKPLNVKFITLKELVFMLEEDEAKIRHDDNPR